MCQQQSKESRVNRMTATTTTRSTTTTNITTMSERRRRLHHQQQQQHPYDETDSTNGTLTATETTMTETTQPSALQTATRVAIVLSIVAYLWHHTFNKRDADNSIAGGNTTFTYSWLVYYSLIIAFVVSMMRYLLRGSSVGSTLRTWKGGMSSLSSVSSSDALSRLSRVSSSDTIRQLSKSIKSSLNQYKKQTALQAITRKECFARLDYIAKLSIADVMILFRYASDVNQVDFDRKKFFSEQSQLVRSLITAIDMAVSISRGSSPSSGGVKLDKTRETGDVDTLYFIAALRVFAEWRNVRVVPTGYKRYAVAVHISYRDLLQNLAKIETGVHSYLEGTAPKTSDRPPVRSPTLREVLQYERDAKVHGNRLPRLEDKSAAAGLLWAKRQLHYQTSIFENMLGIPINFLSMKDAATAAYKEVYDDYHSWAVRQVFCHSFGGSPPPEKILKKMCPPPADKDGIDDALQGNAPARKLSDVSDDGKRGDMDGNDGEGEDNEFLAALEEFGKSFAEKCHDILRHFNCGHDEEDEQHDHTNGPRRNRQHGRHKKNVMLSAESYANISNLQRTIIKEEEEKEDDDGSQEENYDEDATTPSNEKSSSSSSSSPVVVDPISTVRYGTNDFIQEMRPLLKDISNLLVELNMNDPTRA